MLIRPTRYYLRTIGMAMLVDQTFPKVCEAIGKGKTGGIFGVADSAGTSLITFKCGTRTRDDWKGPERYVIEKAARAASYDHKMSHYSRDPDNKRWGGAVQVGPVSPDAMKLDIRIGLADKDEPSGARDYLTFTGFTEADDNGFMLALGYVTKRIELADAMERALRCDCVAEFTTVEKILNWEII